MVVTLRRHIVGIESTVLIVLELYVADIAYRVVVNIK